MKKLITALFLLITCAAFTQPLNVKLAKQDGNWQMLVNGEPFYVKGAGGHVHQDKLIEIGGNTIRTWGIDNAKEILDEAQRNGLKVMMGLWVQHERHGFDYDDAVKVKAQLDGFRSAVMDLKNHPALLMWGVGNEVDLFYKNTNVWYAVEDIAKMIKEIDPNHPTCTVTAGFDPIEAALIMERCPSIDIYGINTYGDIGNVKEGVRKAGWKGPYMITEWGPNGHWEVAKTNWNAPIEQSSFEKADSYEERYKKYISGDQEMCIGSFVFLWGQKQETTSTWYGLFSQDGKTAEPIDRLHKLWKGAEPRNRAPQVKSVLVDGKNKSQSVSLIAEEKYEAKIDVSDLDGDKLIYQWQIIPESTDIKAGGDAESAPLPISGLFTKKKNENAVFYAPAEVGHYRLFIFVYDGNGHYAYENVPFAVTARDPNLGPARPVSFKKMEMKP
jgi:hypothetical protein